MSGTIFAVRHGETYWNKNGIMHGQYDIPLDDKGINQAKQVAKQLQFEHFDICFCSPLSRAKATAMQILLYHPTTKIIYDKRLMELNKGLLEGTHLNSEKMLRNETKELLDKYKIESKAEFFTRVKSLMEEITSNYKDKNVLIVSHSGAIKMMKFYFDPPEETINEAYYKIHIKNCCCEKFKNVKPTKKAKLVYYNDKKSYNNNELRSNNMKKGFYPGVFDVLHTGHLLAIEEAKKNCDYLIIGLHCCPNYKEPVQTIYERYMQLRSCKYVDEIIPYYDINDCRNIIQSLDFDIYFLGEDHKGKTWENDSVVADMDKEIYFISRKHQFSSTYVKDRIIEAGKGE